MSVFGMSAVHTQLVIKLTATKLLQQGRQILPDPLKQACQTLIKYGAKWRGLNLQGGCIRFTVARPAYLLQKEFGVTKVP